MEQGQAEQGRTAWAEESIVEEQVAAERAAAMEAEVKAEVSRLAEEQMVKEKHAAADAKTKAAEEETLRQDPEPEPEVEPFLDLADELEALLGSGSDDDEVEQGEGEVAQEHEQEHEHEQTMDSKKSSPIGSPLAMLAALGPEATALRRSKQLEPEPEHVPSSEHVDSDATAAVAAPAVDQNENKAESAALGASAVEATSTAMDGEDTSVDKPDSVPDLDDELDALLGSDNDDDEDGGGGGDNEHKEPAGFMVVVVQAPEGTIEGDVVLVDTPAGEIQVEIPAGVGPGEEFEVEIETGNDGHTLTEEPFDHLQDVLGSHAAPQEEEADMLRAEVTHEFSGTTATESDCAGVVGEFLALRLGEIVRNPPPYLLYLPPPHGGLACSLA
eukprot:COSAG01_NODE_188_length_22632_cov_15.284915_22_plen_386_part_00